MTQTSASKTLTIALPTQLQSLRWRGRELFSSLWSTPLFLVLFLPPPPPPTRPPPPLLFQAVVSAGSC
ncbi:hypothetical protein NFI96_032250, partial [Prochilodus magdalenae]